MTTCVLCAISSVLYDKVRNLEDYLGIYVDRGYEQDEDLPKKECPVCKREIDFDYRVCPYCDNRFFESCDTPHGAVEVFETDNTDYTETEPDAADYDEGETDKSSDEN